MTTPEALTPEQIAEIERLFNAHLKANDDIDVSREGLNATVNFIKSMRTHLPALLHMATRAPAAADVAGLVERLRDAHANSQQRIAGSDIFEKAADTIAALSEKVRELEESADKWGKLAAQKIKERDTARADALEEAAKVAEMACLVPPDGGEPTEAERAVANEAAKRIRALKRKEG